MKPTLKVLLFWLAVLVVAIVVYQYAEYKRAQSHAAQEQATSGS